MKKYILLIFAVSFILMFQNCSSQNTADSQMVNQLLNAEEFTFHAQRANPTNYDVINVMNSIPNSPSTRILQLDGDGYSIELRKNNLEVVLPYFGRVFNPSYGDSSKSGYRFTSKDYTVTKSQNKKGNWIFLIKPNDVSNVSDINIEVYKNGKAFTSIRSNDRQPITYDGYISKNEDIKVKEKL
ncbi:DUF4251 domain-containing protein [Chryseobacterium sp. GMJ5]|uniref:DUF4251 domain-containing protein n=1 Tax=Chryseobacterium gilvum TaxID=2976534 RepID=A0ABT2VXH1_9FLAO|nr:DUF4251 domain-containing protein [Chryseobacterium gilvum]MCU7614692.1 DUF4251 domain-containing protein [Chryseobacterium gilvum]